MLFGKITKNIYDLAVEKQILPTQRVRWCCAEFKESAGAGKVTLIGIRHAESVRRSKRKEVEISSRKFSGTFEEFEGYREETIKKKYKNLNFDQFAEHQEQMVSCINGKDSILVSPIIEWTESDVWEFLNKVCEVPHCELYDQGYHRIGCIMCPMSSHKQKLKECKDFPHVKHKWIEAIKKIRMGGVSAYEPTHRHNAGECKTHRGQMGIHQGQQRKLLESAATRTEPTLPAQRRNGKFGKRYNKGQFYHGGGGQMARKNTGMWKGNFPNCDSADYP